MTTENNDHKVEFSISLAGFLHEFNGLVGGITTDVKILKMMGGISTKQKRILERLEESAEKALALADEYKSSFGRRDACEAVSISPLLSQIMVEYPPPASISVIIEPDVAIPDVQATKHLIDVFKNLYINALEAMADGGELHIEARVDDASGRVNVTFTDTGRGIPAYLITSLFQPYLSTKNEKGHGLGLWWSKAYLENIGGEIKLISSELGKGTTFLVSLPISK